MEFAVAIVWLSYRLVLYYKDSLDPFTIVAMGGAWWVNIVISVNVYTEKNFYISGIRTRIVEVQYSTHLPTVSML